MSMNEDEIIALWGLTLPCPYCDAEAYDPCISYNWNPGNAISSKVIKRLHSKRLDIGKAFYHRFNGKSPGNTKGCTCPCCINLSIGPCLVNR